MSKFTAKEADDRDCMSTATTLVDIPDIAVTFTQGSPASPVVVRFNADWPKPNAADIPVGSNAAGAFVFLFIDGVRVDLQQRQRRRPRARGQGDARSATAPTASSS